LIELRIHHFFDIIRDYGSGKKIEEHPYGHSYHIIAKKLYENQLHIVKLVIENDDICEQCSKLQFNHCHDSINHRPDFSSKEIFNNYLDDRIMKCMGYESGQNVTVRKLINDSGKYLDKIDEIYSGNDLINTKLRKKNASIGITKKVEELRKD
jgi:hypothetical protein